MANAAEQWVTVATGLTEARANELALVLTDALAGTLDKGIAHRAQAILAETAWGAWQRH